MNNKRKMKKKKKKNKKVWTKGWKEKVCEQRPCECDIKN
jgi:hypothetical protein